MFFKKKRRFNKRAVRIEIAVLLSVALAVVVYYFFKAPSPEAILQKSHLTTVEKKFFEDSISSVNKTSTNGESALVYFSATGNLTIVRDLIARGANVNHRDLSGFTALMKATSNGHTDVVRVLLASGANMEIPIIGSVDTTPLYIASEKGYRDIMLLLLKKGASVDYTRGRRKYSIGTEIFLKYPHDKELQVEVARRVKKPNSRGNIILLLAATYYENERAVRILLSKRTYPSTSYPDGETPLHIAAKAGNLNIMRDLIKKGADIDRLDNDGLAPISVAAREGNEDAVRFLAGKGAEVNPEYFAEDEWAMSPLYLAAINGHAKIVRMLVDRGAVVSYREEFISPVAVALSLDPTKKEIYQILTNAGLLK